MFHEDIGQITTIRNKELEKENANFRCRICDMIAETDAKIVLAEIQNKNLNDFKRRLVRYISTLFVNQDFENNEVKPVKTFLILYYQDEVKKTLNEYTRICREVEEQFDDLMDIAVWSIPEA